MDKNKYEIELNNNTNGSWLFFAILIVCFWGEPDLIDALIYKLTGLEDRLYDDEVLKPVPNINNPMKETE